jgi:hypothetical protein
VVIFIFTKREKEWNLFTINDLLSRLDIIGKRMISQEIDYYEDMKYQDFLLSSRRKIICPPEKIMYYIEIKDALNVADFGMGKGFFYSLLEEKNG